MKSLSMMMERVELDVEYKAEICKNSNGVGGPATCEVHIDEICHAGDDIHELLNDAILERIIDKIVKHELENLK